MFYQLIDDSLIVVDEHRGPAVTDSSSSDQSKVDAPLQVS